MSARNSAALARARRVQAPVFAALGDATRLSLVAKLCERSPQSISELPAGSKLSRQAISKHLQVLQEAGFVAGAHVGRECRYAFDPRPMDDIRSYLDQMSRRWDEALGRLKSFVERSTQ